MLDSATTATYVVAALGIAMSWGVWVSISVFKHAQEIALIKQEIKLLNEVQILLQDIRDDLKFRKK